MNEIETNYSNYETVFHQVFNWSCNTLHCWSKILQKWMHRFEEEINTQTFRAIRKEDDEHWEKAFEQISISCRSEQLLFEVMSNMQKFVNMWIIWTHTQQNTCEGDILKTKRKSKTSYSMIYQKNWKNNDRNDYIQLQINMRHNIQQFVRTCNVKQCKSLSRI